MASLLASILSILMRFPSGENAVCFPSEERAKMLLGSDCRPACSAACKWGCTLLTPRVPSGDEIPVALASLRTGLALLEVRILCGSMAGRRAAPAPENEGS